MCFFRFTIICMGLMCFFWVLSFASFQAYIGSMNGKKTFPPFPSCAFCHFYIGWMDGVALFSRMILMGKISFEWKIKMIMMIMMIMIIMMIMAIIIIMVMMLMMIMMAMSFPSVISSWPHSSMCWSTGFSHVCQNSQFFLTHKNLVNLGTHLSFLVCKKNLNLFYTLINPHWTTA